MFLIQRIFYRDLVHVNPHLEENLSETLQSEQLSSLVIASLIVAYTLSALADLITVYIIRSLNNRQTYYNAYIICLVGYLVKVSFMLMFLGQPTTENQPQLFIDNIFVILTLEVVLITTMVVDQYLPEIVNLMAAYSDKIMKWTFNYLCAIVVGCFAAIWYSVQTAFTLVCFCGTVCFVLYFGIINNLQNAPGVNAVTVVMKVKIIVWTLLYMVVFGGIINQLVTETWYELFMIVFLFLTIATPLFQLIAFCIWHPNYLATLIAIINQKAKRE